MTFLLKRQKIKGRSSCLSIKPPIFQTNKEERISAKLPAQHRKTIEFLCLLQNTSGHLPHWFLLHQLGLKQTCRGWLWSPEKARVCKLSLELKLQETNWSSKYTAAAAGPARFGFYILLNEELTSCVFLDNSVESIFYQSWLSNKACMYPFISIVPRVSDLWGLPQAREFLADARMCSGCLRGHSAGGVAGHWGEVRRSCPKPAISGQNV